jgi:hypothetical protein
MQGKRQLAIAQHRRAETRAIGRQGRLQLFKILR